MASIRNKKIVIATGLYPPDIGGPATYVRMLEDALPTHDIECVVVPFTQVRHLPKVVRHVVFFWKLLRNARDADAVYALDPVSVGVPALVVSTLLRKPFLVRLGGDYAWEQGQQRFGLTPMLDAYTADKQSATWQVRVLASVQSFVVCRALKVVVPSQYMKRIVATWGVTEVQLEVIHSALFPLEVTESKQDIRSKRGYTGTVLCSAARLTPWKGFSVLIDAVQALRTTFPDISIIIAGDGPEEARLKKQVQELNAQDYIIFTGRLSKAELAGCLHASDVFVLNTAYEGLSHQLLEVMDLGVPIVTTDVGGNPELITDGTTGLTVSYDDSEALQRAITSLLTDAALRTTVIENGKKRTKDFNQDTVVTEFVTMLTTHIW